MAVLHGSEDWYFLTKSVLDMKFLTLDDTPDTYATAAGKGLKVSADEVALVFTDMKPDAHHVRHETPAQDQVHHGGLSGLGDDDHPQYVPFSKYYPIGSIYLSVAATNPATLFGFGTWAAFGAGKVIVGLSAGETEFDVVEETGGEKTHALSEAEHHAHVHSVDPPSTNSGGHPTTHDHAFSTGGASGDHVHTTPLVLPTPNLGNVGYDITGLTLKADASTLSTGGASAGHTHSGTTGTENQNHVHPVDIAQFNSGSAGGNMAHNNLQPYIVVYMFKRTA